MRQRVDIVDEFTEVGFCDEYLYKINLMPMPPVVYIKLSKEDTLYGATLEQVDATLNIHGGCTYRGFDEHNSFCIGWDYGHAEDFEKGFPELEEIKEDVCNVVVQLQNRKVASKL